MKKVNELKNEFFCNFGKNYENSTDEVKEKVFNYRKNECLFWLDHEMLMELDNPLHKVIHPSIPYEFEKNSIAISLDDEKLFFIKNFEEEFNKNLEEHIKEYNSKYGERFGEITSFKTEVIRGKKHGEYFYMIFNFDVM